MNIAEKIAIIAENEPKVYEAGKIDGKQAAYDEFSDAFQNFGQRTDYSKAFNGTVAFTEEHIRNLKYKVVPTGNTGHESLFNKNNAITKVEAINIDLSKVTPSQTSQANGNRYVFYICPKLEQIEDVGLPAGYYYYTFGMNYKLHTIELIRSKEDTIFSSAFINDIALKNVRFEGVIGQSISFGHSPLSVDSLKDVILHLKDYTGTDNEHTKTVSFKSSAFSVLEAEGTTAEYNGTPCTWAELIDNKKWNLTLA